MAAPRRLALATVPQADGPGTRMVGGDIGTRGGQQALAVGVSKATADGGMVGWWDGGMVLKAGAQGRCQDQHAGGRAAARRGSG